jgi:signal transduction histidine kinase
MRNGMMRPEMLKQQNRGLGDEAQRRTEKFEDALAVLKQAERKLVQALACSEAANRGKSELLAEVSHEMRTPLSAILGFSKLLLAEKLNPQAASFAGNIHEAGLYLLDLVNDIFDQSRNEKLEPEMRQADLPALVQSCVPLVEHQAQEAGVKLALDIAPNFPAIVTDTRRLKQVLLNLVGNAIKFTPRGGTVTVKAWAEKDKGAYILVVSDTGTGIAAEDIDFALHPRSPDGTGRKAPGVGLPLTKRIVESLGGTLGIRSKAGEGTVVTLHFPHALAPGSGKN